MKELPKRYEGRGEVKNVVFDQIVQSKTAYVYKRHDTEINETHYEVFRRKENTHFNNVSYPSSKAFGVWAWSVPTLTRALEIFKTL